MKHLPLVMGADSSLFAMAVGELGTEVSLGIVLLLTTAMAESPIGLTMARSLAGHGWATLVVDAPGFGLSQGIEPGPDQPTTALEQACTALLDSGAERVAIVVRPDMLVPALQLAIATEQVVGVAAVGLPMPKRSQKMAGKMTAVDYLRRGLRPSTLAGLADRNRRRRYMELVRAKVASRVGRSRTPAVLDALGHLRRNPAINEILDALDHGVRVSLLAGRDDRASRNIRELRDALMGTDQETSLEIDFSYPGKVTSFQSIAAQQWFIETTSDWLGRLPAPSTS